MNDWKLFTGKSEPQPPADADKNDYVAPIAGLPDPPPWRPFGAASLVRQERRVPDEAEREALARKGGTFQTEDEELKDEERDRVIEMVNAALYLRRPLLITGKPGTGKSSLIHAVAHELELGAVLEWPITSRSTLQQGLYSYDAIGRLQEQQRKKAEVRIEKHLQLGPLGTALLPTKRPRALLIDEIDKSDLDLPNDLLNIFEQGWFRIPELERLESKDPVMIREQSGRESFPIVNGEVRCHQFPFVVMTSNDERAFPAPFLRRCLQLRMPEPSSKLLRKIVAAHLGPAIAAEAEALIADFVKRRSAESLATDQLLNALHLVKGQHGVEEKDQARLIDALFKALSSGN